MRIATARVLIVGFLCQPILTYLLTPVLVTDKDGCHAVDLPDQTVFEHHHRLHFSAYSSRAPPPA